jgi:hypothetical protein
MSSSAAVTVRRGRFERLPGAASAARNSCHALGLAADEDVRGPVRERDRVEGKKRTLKSEFRFGFRYRLYVFEN